MKILFIENRYRTKYWEAVAERLEEDGHEFSWIVQNHNFVPTLGEQHVIPYFKGIYSKEKIYNSEIKKVIQSNRGINFFGVRKDDFVFYYRDKIEEVFDKVKPDVVIGECTLFHELLSIFAAKKRQIHFLHPSGCRYPVGRFSFYSYDTLTPIEGCGKKIPENEAEKIASDIENRTVKLDYMVKLNPLSFLEKIGDKMRLTSAHLAGEKFNTPFPYYKFNIEKQKQKNIEKWNDNASMSISKNDSRLKVLYPLQMQPEANIDVWGYPNNNQTEVVKKIANLLKPQEVLYVKPNPKSKYELSNDLIELVNEHPHVTHLHHQSKMQEVFSEVDLIITVTGTVSIEACMSNMPVVMLGKSLTSQLKNCVAADSDNDIRIAINQVAQGTFPKLTQEEKGEYINLVYSTSYEGINGDSLHNRHHLEDKRNFGLVVAAFKDILGKIAKK